MFKVVIKCMSSLDLRQYLVIYVAYVALVVFFFFVFPPFVTLYTEAHGMCCFASSFLEVNPDCLESLELLLLDFSFVSAPLAEGELLSI